MASDKTVAFVVKNFEALAIGTIAFLGVVGVVCLSFGVIVLGATFLSLAVILGGIGVWLVFAYKAWERDVERLNSIEPKDGESAVELTPEQYEAVIRDGFLILPNGEHVVSDRFKKTMKHIKSEDHDALNGPILTEKNADYDGPRINNFEEKYGKHYGKRMDNK